MTQQQPAFRYELINAKNIRSVADMLLWGAKRFTIKNRNFMYPSSKDLRWEQASMDALFGFLDLCLDEGLHPVNCFGDLAKAREYPIFVHEGTDLSDVISNEVWDDLSFIMEVDVRYWDTVSRMFEDKCGNINEIKGVDTNGI